jgi:hypothetical protein
MSRRPSFDPIREIQNLPWPNLFQAAGWAVGSAILADWGLGLVAWLSLGLLLNALPEVGIGVLRLASTPIY